MKFSRAYTDSTTNSASPVLDAPAFLRLFQLRTAEIMWFLGAGASRAAGIKTASDMIWDFKQRLYRSQKKLPPSAITDIGEPTVRRKLQSYFDALGSFPPFGAESEYSTYFEATYPAPKDRRAYLEELIARGKPSFGHLALALLMAEKLCHAVWTTNFDRTIEDATAQVLGGTGHLVTADLAEPDKLRRAWSEHRWPIYAKLHGDYQSEHVKNTDAELRTQDAKMRSFFIDACRRQGLAIIGYSGRDASIMNAFMEALDNGRGFPSGLFWFKRSQDNPYPTVVELINNARALNIDAHFIEAESFDELLSDLIRFLPQTADKIQRLAGATRPRLVKSTPLVSAADTPAVRTNALPIVSRPALCRLVDCKIGGYDEVRAAIDAAGVDIDARRSRAGVLAFGRDADIRRAFEPYGIKAFEPHPLPSSRLTTETGERALLRDALFRALGKRPGLRFERRGYRTLLMPDPAVVRPTTFNTDKVKPIDRISGTIAPGIRWTEACGLRLDYRLDQLWLLIEPRVILDVPEGTTEDQLETAREFVRERRARRHNRHANAMLDGWIALADGTGARFRLRAFDIADGVDAEFELIRISGFSGTAG
jgi:NAD-dependent SIR2 family protein deacetylase